MTDRIPYEITEAIAAGDLTAAARLVDAMHAAASALYSAGLNSEASDAFIRWLTARRVVTDALLARYPRNRAAA